MFLPVFGFYKWRLDHLYRKIICVNQSHTLSCILIYQLWKKLSPRAKSKRQTDSLACRVHLHCLDAGWKKSGHYWNM